MCEIRSKPVLIKLFCLMMTLIYCKRLLTTTIFDFLRNTPLFQQKGQLHCQDANRENKIKSKLRLLGARPYTPPPIENKWRHTERKITSWKFWWNAIRMSDVKKSSGFQESALDLFFFQKWGYILGILC